MKNVLLLLAALCVFVGVANAEDSYVEYRFHNLSLKVPKCLSLRGDQNVANKIATKITDAVSLSDERVVFQPVGLNSQDRKEYLDASSKYCRVILERVYVDDFYTDEEMRNLREDDETMYYLKQAQKEEIERWWKLKKIEMSVAFFQDKPCLFCGFVRSGLNGDVSVQMLTFFEGHDKYVLTLSYRLSEEHLWRDALFSIKCSLKYEKR
ncbi:MAG: hypothetical protein II951_03470 [Bacteroidales bacterium]|nr:hypothetical protein [Bacteroidales bacterium]